MKTLLITFFDIKDAVHFEFIPQVQTVIQTYYVEISKRLLEAVHRKRPELWPNDWILHHNNASANKALSVKQFLSQKPISEMGHLLCSPDLAHIHTRTNFIGRWFRKCGARLPGGGATSSLGSRGSLWTSYVVQFNWL